MRDRHRRERGAGGEHGGRRGHLQHDLRGKPDREKRHGQTSSKLQRQHQREQSRVDSRQAAIGLNVRRKQEDCNRNGKNAGEQRRVKRAGVLPRAGNAEAQEDDRVPRELLKSEMREVTGNDAPQSAAALELERGARNQRGG